jgi:hypothetical protein
VATALRRGELARLVDTAHEATVHLAPATSAVALYLEASSVAEARIPGPLGTAVAGVLAIAAEQRIASGLRGNLGEHRTMLNLATQVLSVRGTR